MQDTTSYKSKNESMNREFSSEEKELMRKNQQDYPNLISLVQRQNRYKFYMGQR